jgi:3-oxoacyl-[acyl-carrier protein] reductase
MKDAYLNFVNAPFGARVAGALGLPKPVALRRYRANEAEFDGIVALGAGAAPQSLDLLADTIAQLGLASVAHPGALAWIPLAHRRGLMTGRFEPVDAGARSPIAALLFDASGIEDSAQLDAAYAFFHDTLRSLRPCGRIVVLGRPPRDCASVRAATAQRALGGLVRSLGKEARRGITSNLIQLAPGAGTHAGATLRFFLSPRSAYVSGQTVCIDVPPHADAGAPPVDWRQPLTGRRALVTGAARGIGAAIATALAADGAHVTGLDIPSARDALDETLRPSGGTALAFDLADADAGAQIAAALDDLGVDIVVHNAGITQDRTIVRMDETAWRRVIDINLAAQARIDDALLAAGTLRDGGRIVSVSSISGIAGNIGQTHYATSKAGIIGRVEALAPLLRARRITINAVAPGFIETQMTAKIPFAIREAGRRMNSLAQGGLPEDVAQAIAWLAQPGCAGITGQVVRVCGQSLIGA